MNIVWFAFKGEEICFTHILLNALDAHRQGHEARIVIEGEAVRLVEPLQKNEHPLFAKALNAGLIDGICRACSAKLGVLDYNASCGIALLEDMSGHPSMEPYLRQGFQVITL